MPFTPAVEVPDAELEATPDDNDKVEVEEEEEEESSDIEPPVVSAFA